jgi:adenylate kinase
MGRDLPHRAANLRRDSVNHGITPRLTASAEVSRMAEQRRYRTILLFGMPGSGKGTQGAVLGQLPDLVHISMGDVFRKIPKWGKFGPEIARYASKGALVPDDLTVRIWERHIQILEMQELLLPDQHTLILDGIPRNYSQAERLEHILDVVQIFHLHINDNVKASERLKARALRENRLDDMNEEVIKRRLGTYYEETFKTLSFFPQEVVFDIDAGQSPLEVLRDIVERLTVVQQSRTGLRPSAMSELGSG